MKFSIALFVFIVLHCFVSKAQTADSILIRQLLEKESATWRSGDLKAHAACWHIQPYSKIWFSTSDGRFIDVPPQTIVNPPPGFAGKGGTAVNSNYKMHVDGNSAWVTHDEVSTSADGKKTMTAELRLLEKIDGEWKLVGTSVHAR